jgi:predicted dehydrogenase
MIGEVVDVQSRPRIAVTERPDADGVMHACTAEDGFTASLVLASGVTVAIDSSFAAAANVAPRLTVFGSDAVAELTADARLVVRRAGGAREEVDVPSGMLTDWGDPHLVPMQRLAAALRAAVEDGDPAPELATFADGRACDAVLERLRPSQV